jgi:hypothetical protein
MASLAWWCFTHAFKAQRSVVNTAIMGARSKVPRPGQIPILQAADIVITNLSSTKIL